MSTSDRRRKPFRFPVQWVNRPEPRLPRLFRHRRDRDRSRPGDPIVVAGSGTDLARQASIVTQDGDLRARRGRRRGDA